MRKKPARRASSVDLLCDEFGGVSADVFDENPITRTLAILEFCARIKQNPPPWAVKRWADHVGRARLVDRIRALAVENSSGTVYRRGNRREYDKFERARTLLARRAIASLSCGLPVLASVHRIRTSFYAAADRRFHGPYRYLGLKAWLKTYLPLLVEALEQKDAPVHPFFW